MKYCTLLLLLVWSNGHLFAQKNKFVYTQFFSSKSEIEQTKDPLERLYRSMIGHFSNRVQADTATIYQYRAQEVISVPIWRHRKGEYWIYQCRIPAGKPNFVVEDVIMQLRKVGGDSIEIVYYHLNVKNKSYYALEWNKNEPFRRLDPKDLLAPNCKAYALPQEDGYFDFFSTGVCEYQMTNHISKVHYRGRVGLDDLRIQSSYHGLNNNIIFEYKGKGLYLHRLPHDRLIYTDKVISSL